MYQPLNQTDDNISYINEETPANEDDIYSSYLFKLKYASKCGSVAKGLKEVLRAIRSGKAKIVYLAKDCDRADYKKLVEEFSDLNKVKKVDVKDWMEIRDSVMECVPSGFILEKAKRNGKSAKVTPKCYCAAVLEYGDIEKRVQESKK